MDNLLLNEKFKIVKAGGGIINDGDYVGLYMARGDGNWWMSCFCTEKKNFGVMDDITPNFQQEQSARFCKS